LNKDAETITRVTNNITPYLTSGENVFIEGQHENLSSLPEMAFGNMPVDEGNLLMSERDVAGLKLELKDRHLFVRQIYGSAEYIRGTARYCLWIPDQHLHEAMKNEQIRRRIEKVRLMRLASRDKGTKDMAKRPHQFREMNESQMHTVIVPIHSSESREYLPVGLIGNRCVVTNAVFALYDAPLWNIGLIASRLHLVWIATVCGKIKTDYRYSNTLGWNIFPVPTLTEQNKADLSRCAENILLAREAHFPATIADLYDPDRMPENLRHAHDQNDEALERIYIGRCFRNDTERLEKLFELYTKMAAEQPATKAKRKVQA
jgi:hypothetical protein